VNTDLYAFVALVLQAAQALNITAPGGHNYNVPTGTINNTLTGDSTPPTLTDYTQVAIAGADDFADGGVTIKDVFDIIVSNTREVTPTCRFSPISSYIIRSSHSPVPDQVGTLWTLGCAQKQLFSEDIRPDKVHSQLRQL
jgi:hypothetical protein